MDGLNIKFPQPLLPSIKMPEYTNLLSNIDLNNSNKFNNIISGIEELQHNDLLKSIDNLDFTKKLKENELKNCKRKFDSLKKSLDIRTGIICSVIVSVISMIIPFIIVSFSNYLEKFVNFIFTYMIISFILSIAIIFWYLIYTYKK